jgi:uncharacterized membrane protein
MRRLGLVCAAAVVLVSTAGADEPIPKYQVITPKDDGIIATGINERGVIVGFEWVDDKEHPGVLMQAPFYFTRGSDVTYLPLLKGYTSTFPAAVSDGGLVVGRVSKPAPPGVSVPLRNQAFVWDAQAGIRGLGVPEGDNASFACGVSRDGRSISGFAVGPSRVRVCVWDRERDAWKVTVLPHEGKLSSNVVPTSADGRRIAAVDGQVPCLWSRSEAGDWTREPLAAANTLVPRGVNNSGTVVGLVYTDQGSAHAVVWSRDKGLKTLEEPKGYVKSEALAVNNVGVIAGMIDGPNGSKIGPRAFVYEAGRLRILEEGGPKFAAATALNDHGQVAGVLEHDDDEPDK